MNRQSRFRTVLRCLVVGGAICAAGVVVEAEAAEPSIAVASESGVVPASGVAIGSLSPALSRAATALLAAAIEQIRDDAIVLGVRPLPPDVREAFTGHLPESLLDAVRWRVAADGLSLPGGILLLGDTPALTSGHVIVFADLADTKRPLVWAHELYHTLQYLDWGVQEFASRYVADADGVEHAANEFVWRWQNAGGSPGQLP